MSATALLSDDMVDAVGELAALLRDLTPEGRVEALAAARAVVDDETLPEQDRAYAVTVQIGLEEIEKGRDPGLALLGVYGVMAAHENGRQQAERRAMRSHSGRRRRRRGRH